MKRSYLRSAVLGFAALTVFASCSKTDEPTPVAGSNVKYVLMTMSENVLTKPGYVSAFDAIPSGNISNINSSTLDFKLCKRNFQKILL
ncbi:MAG: hypothetical protein EOP45_23795 [Sphingobacteriaceae bacterium]|nr:MAG: hypothetical protein EOP45_23795 [Sphingobacteriaceae bacterium]